MQFYFKIQLNYLKYLQFFMKVYATIFIFNIQLFRAPTIPIFQLHHDYYETYVYYLKQV